MNDSAPNASNKPNPGGDPNNANNVNGAKEAQAPGANGTSAPAAQAETATPEAQIKEAQGKAAEYLEGWQRERAEFANYRKRADQERADLYQSAAAETLRKILPVIDDFDRAIANVPAEKTEDDVTKGFILIHRKLLALLENANIKVIDPKGEAFNPAFHEAIGQDAAGTVPSGHVTMVLQKGYMFGDLLLRPALVRVAG
ncbi:MAG TPA: nucleotide exchange factor GrpE [Aggregatilineales bacterium]|nr:nucleotide exchange factor GrpE [Aggregatilineales bacterium]